MPRPQPVTVTDELLAHISDQLGQVLDRLPRLPESGPDDQGRTLVSEPKAEPPRPTSPRPGRKRVTGN